MEIFQLPANPSHLERNRLLFREPLSFLFSDFIALWKKSIQRHPSGQHLERERFFSLFIRKTNTCHTADVGTPMMSSWEWWFKLFRVIPSFFQGSVNYHPSITHCGGMKLDAKKCMQLLNGWNHVKNSAFCLGWCHGDAFWIGKIWSTLLMSWNSIIGLAKNEVFVGFS